MRNLYVGVPFKEDVAGVHYRSMLRFQKRYPDIDVITSDGTRIDRQRNEIVRTFLALDREWLLQIDSDMEFYPEDVEDLMCPGDTVIRTGLICNRERTPVLGERVGGDGTRTSHYRLLPKFEEPRTIDACGGAFLLVNREVYEKLDDGSEYPWFQFTQLGEDWEFCRRAREAGFDIWAIPQANIGHRKGYTVRA